MKKYLRSLSHFLIHALNVVFIVIMISLTLIALFKPDWIELALKWIEWKIVLLGAWNYLIAFFTSIIESFPALGVVIPGQQVMLIVGWFFGKQNLLPMILVCIVGALIGNYIGYFLWVRFGEKFFHHYGDYFGLGRTELKYLKKQIEKNGAWFIILGKFHNFTRAFVPFIAGSMGMKEWKFWVYNIIGSILWATTIITLGVVFAHYYELILSYLRYILWGILVIVIGYIYFFKKAEFKSYLAQKEQEVVEKQAEKEKNK